MRSIIGSVYLGASLAIFANINALENWQFWAIFIPTMIIFSWRNK